MYLSEMVLFRNKVKLFLICIIAVIIMNVFGVLTHLFEMDYYTQFSYPLDVNMEEIIAALKTGKTTNISPINENNYRFKIKNNRKCKQNNQQEYDKVVILYMIKSALSHQNRRNAIRKSWGWENRFSDVVIRRIFLLGASEDLAIQDDIDEEYARYKDIVQADFIDTYYNNTIKTLMGFKWVIQNCPNAQFIMFADDDMYISTKNLLRFLRNPFGENIDNKKVNAYPLPNSKIVSAENREAELVPSAYDGRLLAGYVFFSAPMRHKTSKWYITLDEYPFSKYPPYVTAGAYVMTYPALFDMYYTSLYTKPFKFDDVYLGIVAKKCRITPLHNENFYFWREPYDAQLYAPVIASHGFEDTIELQKVWEEQRSLGHA